ncbi:patatin-like phospholipase family protein [Allopusillimonas ginsengisoli]|uniref:patatin-like phospholipase family protein n=1 Tax=Allopusillimonas ginsengisoli TaxID=453575 RepID=UPI0039C25054
MPRIQRRKPRLGLVLGSGSARGWAHIGVIQTLKRAGIEPDIVCGTSIGALVGAAYAVGELDRFEEWVLSLGLRDVISFMDLRLNGGMLKGGKLMEFFRRNFIDLSIEDLQKPFGAVATDLETGAEVWLRSGSAIDAIRASIALPGLFAPVWHEDRLLVDGGLVNPVPVSLARAMGADILIAVDLNSDLLGRHLQQDRDAEAHAEPGTQHTTGAMPDIHSSSGPDIPHAFNAGSLARSEPDADSHAAGETTHHADSRPLSQSATADSNIASRPDTHVGSEWMKRLQQNLTAFLPSPSNEVEEQLPSMLDVMASSVNIMQIRITRSRMAGDPPDAVIAPRLSQLGLLDFHQAQAAIEEGHRAAERCLPALRELGLGGGRKA